MTRTPAACWMGVALLLVVGIAHESAAQTALAVVPVEWPAPLYPQIAQSARVMGEVEVAIDVRPDGTVAAVEAIAGPSLLRQASEEAARRARFECRGCTEGTVRYTLDLTYRLLGRGCVEVLRRAPQIVSPTRGRVTVDVEVMMLIDPASTAVRSGRCLWLWRCGLKTLETAPVTPVCSQVGS